LRPCLRRQTLGINAVADEELSDVRSRWVRTLMSYPKPLREAVEDNCEALFEIADRSCPTPRGVKQ